LERIGPEPSMDIAIRRHEAADTLLLTVSGRLDAEHADDLARAVDEELRRGHHAIAIDLRECGFLSSAGIRVLFQIHRAAERVGGHCLIRDASAPVRKVLELTRLAALLMEQPSGDAGRTPPGPPPATAEEIALGSVRLIGVERPTATVQGRLVGSADIASCDRPLPGRRRPLTRDSFALGLAALAENGPLADRAGEMLSACGIAFHRRPHPFSVVDYMATAGDLVPEIDIAHGLIWTGVPTGRMGFESVSDEPVAVDELVARLFEQTEADVLAVVVAGETAGLVGAELIRPLAEVSATDRPDSTDRAVAARWLSFSREPVHARRAAVVVGVATRDAPSATLAPFLRPLGHGMVHGHLHAVVFPPRPLARGAGDLSATVEDLAASAPLALMHLLRDPEPVLGSGRSTMERGRCWFAPLVVEGGTT
jgi:stage II sporulation protein AA (anti-sigma F factor antagonist)